MTPTEAEHSRFLLEKLDACQPTGMLMSNAGPWPTGTGIRPELVSVNQEGVHNYHLSKKQAARFAEVIRTELALAEGAR